MADRLVFSYQAFSHGSQRDGRSTDRQGQSAAEWAKDHGFTLAPERVYVDRGRSRYSGNAQRLGMLGKFLQLCGTPAVPRGSILVIEDFDRLSRESMRPAWDQFERILLAGVDIVVLSLGQWFTAADLEKLEPRIIVQVAQHRAHESSKLLSGRIRDIWTDRRRRAAAGKGVHTHLPAWVRRAADGSLEFIPERAAALRLFVSWAMAGMGADSIAIRAATEAPCRPWCRGGKWSGESIYAILRGCPIWGAYQPQAYDEQRRLRPVGAPVEGHYPALLSRDAADELKRAIARRGRRKCRAPKAVRYCLQALCFDAETGIRLRLKGEGKHSEWVYLERVDGGKSSILAPAEAVQRFVLHAVQEMLPADLAGPGDSGAEGALHELLAELGALQADRAAIQGELAKPGRAASTVGILAAQLDSLDAREGELKERLADMEAAGAGAIGYALHEAQSAVERLEALPAAARPAALCALNDRLHLLLDGVWLYRERFSMHRSAVYVQVWPRAGAAKFGVIFMGKPPQGWKPLPIHLADLRQGYPAPITRDSRERGRRAPKA